MENPLYRLRKNLDNITLYELARDLNVSYALLYNVEKGNYKKLPPKFLENLKEKGMDTETFEENYQEFVDSLPSVDWGKA